MRPVLPKPPSATELEAVAYKALRLPATEESAEHGLAHFLGTITLERNDTALDAVIKLWTKRVRAALHVLRDEAPRDWYRKASDYALPPAEAKSNFLRFHEYLDRVREFGGARDSRPAAPHIDRTRYDRFVTVYRRLRHSPDRAGYTAYREDVAFAVLEDVAVAVPEHEVFSFAEYQEACQVIERSSGSSGGTTAAKPWDTNVHGRFAASFDARRHTPDRRGYRRYLDDHAAESIRTFIKKRLPVCLPEKDRKLNSYIFASPGSGKSEFLKLLVHAETRKPRTAVVAIDVAHDFAEQLRFREFAEDDGRLVYIDPYLEYGFTPTINPFVVKGPFLNEHHEQHVKDRVAGQIYEVLKELLSRKEGGGFSAPMEPILTYSIRALLDIPGATFEHLERLWLRDPALVVQCQASTSSRAAEFFRDTFPRDNTKRSCEGLVSRLQATVLATEAFKDLTCGRQTIELERLINERKIIVFNLAKGEVTDEVSLAFGRFVLATITAIGLRRARLDETERTPTHVIIDEFQNFVADSVFKTIMELRKFNIMQTFVQPNLFGGMSTDQRHAFLDGVRGTLCYGKCSSRTAQFVAELADLDAEELVELGRDDKRRGEFFVWTQGRPPFLLNIDTRLLGSRHSMSESEWEPIKRRQLERYYRSKETEKLWRHAPAFEAPSPPEPEVRERPTPRPEPELAASSKQVAPPPQAAPPPKAAARATEAPQSPPQRSAPAVPPKEKPKAKRDPFASMRPPRRPPPPEPR